METHLSIRKLDFDEAQSLGGNEMVITKFKESVRKVHKQYETDFEKISTKVSKIFAYLFCSQAWDKLSQEYKSEVRNICNLHHNQESFQAQNWSLLLKTK